LRRRLSLQLLQLLVCFALLLLTGQDFLIQTICLSLKRSRGLFACFKDLLELQAQLVYAILALKQQLPLRQIF
jgi:hypothetical protein